MSWENSMCLSIVVHSLRQEEKYFIKYQWRLSVGLVVLKCSEPVFAEKKLGVHSWRWQTTRSCFALEQASLFFLLGSETTLCKTPHFQWIYGKLNQIYEKLRSDQMDPNSALGGPKPIARTGRSLLKNWSYTSNPCIYFSILLDWRAHLAKTLFIPHKYIKCALL